MHRSRSRKAIVRSLQKLIPEALIAGDAVVRAHGCIQKVGFGG